MNVVVVGGGISGLAAAYRLHKAGVGVTLFEASGRTGGVIQTLHRHGCLLEAGPDSWASNKPAALELVRELGLESEVIGTREGVRRSLILHRGRLKPLPEGFFLISPMSLRALWKTDVLSLRAKLRMACDLVKPRRRGDADESLAGFVRRRFGREALQRIAQPMVAGIYTADPEKLSLKATFPQFIDYERQFGSVIRGLRARGQVAEKVAAGPRYGMFLSLKNGMGSLVAALESALPSGCVRLNAAVRGVNVSASGVTIEAGNETLTADGAVLALPAPRAADLLAGVDAQLAAALGTFAYAGAAVVNFVFAREQIGHPMDGMGAVIPAVEGRGIIAFSFSSVKFAGRAPEGVAVVRVFLGGALNPQVAALPEAELVHVALSEIRRLIDIEGEPLGRYAASHLGAMPQYHVGHLEKVVEVQHMASKNPRLAICGNAFDGIGIPDCIRGANDAVAGLLGRIGA